MPRLTLMLDFFGPRSPFPRCGSQVKVNVKSVPYYAAKLSESLGSSLSRVWNACGDSSAELAAGITPPTHHLRIDRPSTSHQNPIPHPLNLRTNLTFVPHLLDYPRGDQAVKILSMCTSAPHKPQAPVSQRFPDPHH